MDQQEQIEYNNLVGEVALLRELIKALSKKLLPFEPASTQALVDACEAARKVYPPLSPRRIAVDHAINTLAPHNWIQRK